MLELISIITDVNISIILIICTINFIFALFLVITLWIMINKANQPGWSVIVPFYNLYILNKIANMNIAWVIITIISFPFYLFFSLSIQGYIIFKLTPFILRNELYAQYINLNDHYNIVFIIAILISLLLIILTFYTIYYIFFSINIAKQFNCSGWFTLGLIIFPVVFYAIMAFNKNIVYNDVINNEEIIYEEKITSETTEDKVEKMEVINEQPEELLASKIIEEETPNDNNDKE